MIMKNRFGTQASEQSMDDLAGTDLSAGAGDSDYFKTLYKMQLLRDAAGSGGAESGGLLGGAGQGASLGMLGGPKGALIGAGVGGVLGIMNKEKELKAARQAKREAALNALSQGAIEGNQAKINAIRAALMGQ